MSAEIDRPPNLLISGIVVGVIAATFGLLVVVAQFFDYGVQQEISEKVLTRVNPQLGMVRADEQSKLTHFQWVDQKAGVVRIPLDRAVEMTLKEWPSRPSGTMAPPVDPNAPAPGAAVPAPGAAVPAPGAAVPAPAGNVAPAPGSAVPALPKADKAIEKKADKAPAAAAGAE